MSQQKQKKKKVDKRRVLVTVLAAVMALALILPLLSTAFLSAHAVTQTELQNQIAGLKSSASEAAAKKKEIESQLAAIRNDKAKAMDQLNLLSQQLNAIDEEIANTQSQINTYQELIIAQEAALEEAKDREQAAEEKFRRRARAMEEAGDISYLSVLFQADSFSDLLDRLAMVDEIVAYDNSVVESLAAARSQVEATLADLRETEAGLEEQKALQEEQRKEQAAKVEEAADLVNSIKQDEANVQALHEAAAAEAKKVEADIAKKEKELKEMVEAAKRAAAFTTGSGYYYPLPSSCTHVTSKFGYRTCPYHGWELHRGVDIAAPSGTNVSAVQGGVVIVSAYAPSSYGEYIMIDHGNGRTTLYAHMQRNSRRVKVGDVVSQGQVIGLAGMTGTATGPHLHLELKVNGELQNALSMYPGVQFTGSYK